MDGPTPFRLGHCRWEVLSSQREPIGRCCLRPVIKPIRTFLYFREHWRPNDHWHYLLLSDVVLHFVGSLELD